MMNTPQKTIELGALFDEKDFNAIVSIRNSDAANFHARCVSEVIKPKLEQINKAAGQEMDPTYLAYALEYALTQSGQ